MPSCYILYSKSLDRFYIGSCIDFSERMKAHLEKKFASSFTARASDWTIFLDINALQIVQARKIELHIKRMKSKKYIHDLQKYPDMIEKLKSRFLTEN